MSATLTLGEGRVEYYDHCWGGYRRIDSFGDRPTAVFPRRRALEEARKLARGHNLDTRVVAETDKGEVITRYRKRTAARY